MHIKRILFTILIVGGVGIYVWDFLLIARNFTSGSGGAAVAVAAAESFDESVLSRSVRSVQFVVQGKSPLSAYKVPPKPVASAKPAAAVSVAAATAKPVVSAAANAQPPAITINGIMWNPQNPVVMLGLPDGSSTVAKPGQSVADGVVIKRIERNQIVVTYQGKEFRLK
jgi:type II secretory pathway component PulC